MTRKDREASRKELEASAERVCQEIARKMREGMLHFFDRLEDVLPDTVRVMRDAQTKGEAVDRVKLEKSDHRHRRLLRAGSERPHRRRAAEKANELTSPHILTQAQGPVLYRLKRVL